MTIEQKGRALAAARSESSSTGAGAGIHAPFCRAVRARMARNLRFMAERPETFVGLVGECYGRGRSRAIEKLRQSLLRGDTAHLPTVRIAQTELRAYLDRRSHCVVIGARYALDVERGVALYAEQIEAIIREDAGGAWPSRAAREVFVGWLNGRRRPAPAIDSRPIATPPTAEGSIVPPRSSRLARARTWLATMWSALRGSGATVRDTRGWTMRVA